MADNDEPVQIDDLEERIREVQKVKDIDPEVLASNRMGDLLAELEYISDDNEAALREQAMRELGYL